MKEQNKLSENQFRELMGSLPSRTPGGLDDRIMAQVRKSPAPAERRSDRRLLVWSIALGAVILAVGIGALSMYIDWSNLLAGMNTPEITPAPQKAVVDSKSWELAKSLLPFTGIVLFLLIGDSLLRRRLFMKRHKGGE